jgi:uncharacterized membrane protein
MLVKIQKVLKFFMLAAALLYPLVIFLSFVVFDIPMNHLSLFIIVFALLYLIISLSGSERRKSVSAFISPSILFLIGIAGFFFDSSSSVMSALFPALAGKSKEIIKFYPLLVNIGWLAVFGFSLLFPPSFVFEIAVFLDKSVKDADVEKPLRRFCKSATVVWCVFFAFDALFAWFTIFGPLVNGLDKRHSDMLWTVYNGAVTYLLMGVIFIIQFVMVKRRMKKIRTHK